MEELKQYCAAKWPITHVAFEFAPHPAGAILTTFGDPCLVEKNAAGYWISTVRRSPIIVYDNLEYSDVMREANILEKYYDSWRATRVPYESEFAVKWSSLVRHFDITPMRFNVQIYAGYRYVCECSHHSRTLHKLTTLVDAIELRAENTRRIIEQLPQPITEEMVLHI